MAVLSCITQWTSVRFILGAWKTNRGCIADRNIIDGEICCRLLYEHIVKKLIRDGIALAYEEAGSGLPPMLLVHCWCCDYGALANRGVLNLFGRGHRVISVDLRGHGKSDKPAAGIHAGRIRR